NVAANRADDLRTLQGQPGVTHFSGRLEHRRLLFQPGAQHDRLTVHIPLPLLNQIEEAGFEWQIPGLRRELIIALIKSLPKPVRR
ncbi:DUF3418 domain-containing protein, partial [Klebsiella pneumoniae]|nr:DUF3418 domain-containing protein [Klebsiella pneumoniae]